MTKMDMIWIAVAGLLHPEPSSSKTVTRSQIEAEVLRLFGASITPVMIEKHLVSWEKRQADKADPRRGGSRNRYLFKTGDGATPSRDGTFRLYKAADAGHDGRDKGGPTHPDPQSIDAGYRHLVSWYEQHYFNAA